MLLLFSPTNVWDALYHFIFFNVFYKFHLSDSPAWCLVLLEFLFSIAYRQDQPLDPSDVEARKLRTYYFFHSKVWEAFYYSIFLNIIY
jgi:hypothetical protein